MHYALWKAAKEQIAALDKERQKLAKPKQKEVERLKEIPGVGNIVACTFLAYVSRPKRFNKAKQIASYTGLIP